MTIQVRQGDKPPNLQIEGVEGSLFFDRSTQRMYVKNDNNWVLCCISKAEQAVVLLKKHGIIPHNFDLQKDTLSVVESKA